MSGLNEEQTEICKRAYRIIAARRAERLPVKRVFLTPSEAHAMGFAKDVEFGTQVLWGVPVVVGLFDE